MSVNCGFSSECKNEVTQELVSNGKKTYSCQIHLSEILQKLGGAESVKPVDLSICPDSKKKLIELLLNSLKTLKDFSQSLIEMNSKTVKAILDEQGKVLSKTSQVSQNLMKALSAVQSVSSFKTYETLSELLRLLLQPPDKVQDKYKELMLVELNFRKINGINSAEIKDCIEEKMTRKRPQFQGRCTSGHNLLLSVDTSEYYSFINHGPASTRCDECKGKIEAVSHHCRICKYDYCESCCIQNDYFIRTKPLCPENHQTELIVDVTRNFMGMACNLCRQDILKNSWRCSTCDFDICEFCTLKAFVQPIFEYPLTCANKHRMVCCLDNERFNCKICMKAESNEVSWKCDKCKIRLCKDCALILGHKSPGCSKNHQMTHYCARTKGFGWFKIGNCKGCGTKMDDFGFTCKACEFHLCEACFLGAPAVFLNN